MGWRRTVCGTTWEPGAVGVAEWRADAPQAFAHAGWLADAPQALAHAAGSFEEVCFRCWTHLARWLDAQGRGACTALNGQGRGACTVAEVEGRGAGDVKR